MHTDPPVYHGTRRAAFRLKAGEPSGGKMQLLLHEVRRTLLQLSELGETTVIDLRDYSRLRGSTGKR